MEIKIVDKKTGGAIMRILRSAIAFDGDSLTIIGKRKEIGDTRIPFEAGRKSKE